MAKLTLEKTMKTSFIEMRDTQDVEGARKAFKDYNRRIKLLGSERRLDIDSTDGTSGVIAQTGRQFLSETDQDSQELYLPGFSAVVVDVDGRILGARDTANDIPKLSSYGSQIMWALLKVGQESFAVAHAKSTASLVDGYGAVGEALTGEPIGNVPYADRPHIGGSTVPVSSYPTSTSMRKFEMEPLYAGVSGVICTPAFRDYAVASNPGILPIMHEAYSSPDVLDGFEGNMFAGSIDSTLASFILSNIVGSTPGGERPFTDQAVQSIAARHASGINIH